MEFHKKYSHVGISYPEVPNGWLPIVEKAIQAIEKEMWPRWIPMPLCRLIHWLAMGNSIVRIKYHWAFELRQRLTRGQMITDIKEKYATLRIYGFFGDEIDVIIDQAEKECNDTCQECGTRGNVHRINVGWVYNVCDTCADIIRNR